MKISPVGEFWRQTSTMCVSEVQVVVPYVVQTTADIPAGMFFDLSSLFEGCSCIIKHLLKILQQWQPSTSYNILNQ